MTQPHPKMMSKLRKKSSFSQKWEALKNKKNLPHPKNPSLKDIIDDLREYKKSHLDRTL